jgi:hypothetical protein
MLAKNPNDEHALFSLCVTVGKFGLYGSGREEADQQPFAGQARTAYAQRLLKVNPNYDAHSPRNG